MSCPPDVFQALERAAGKESNPRAAALLRQLVENARIAVRDQIPLCQDTGLTVVFVEQGAEVAVVPAGPGRQTLIEAINEGVRAGYEAGYLRKSVVADPLHGARTPRRTRRPSSTSPSCPATSCKLTVMAKGGGCENKSQFRMFRPTAGRQEIMDWMVERRPRGRGGCVSAVRRGRGARRQLRVQLPAQQKGPAAELERAQRRSVLRANGAGPAGSRSTRSA